MSLHAGCNHRALLSLDLAAVCWRNYAIRTLDSLPAQKKKSCISGKRRVKPGVENSPQNPVGVKYPEDGVSRRWRGVLSVPVSGRRLRNGARFPWESLNLLPLSPLKAGFNAFGTQAYGASDAANRLEATLTEQVGAFDNAVLPMPFHDLQGSQRDFEMLHQVMRRLENQGVSQADIGDAHNLLVSAGPEKFRDLVEGYLSDASACKDHSVLNGLDMQLLLHHDLLLEDLSMDLLRRWKQEPNLLHDTARVAEIRKHLYGERTSFPILRNGAGMAVVADGGSERASTLRRRQLIVERLTQKAAYMEYKEMQLKMASEGRASSNPSQSRVWMEWVREMTLRINIIRNGSSITGGSASITEYGISKHDHVLCDSTLPSELLGVITCQTVLNKVYMPRWGRGGRQEEHQPVYGSNAMEERRMCVPFVNAVVAVGEAVGLESCWRESERRPEMFSGESKRSSLRLSTVIALMKRSGSDPDYEFELKSRIVPLGAALVDMLLSCATIRDKEKGEVHAFSHELVREGKKLKGYLVLERNACEQMDLSLDDAAFFVPKLQPMISLPRPWKPGSDHPEGGFLLHKVPFIRTSNQIGTNLKVYDIQRVSRVMDFLGSTPWRVNQRVLDVMEKAWEQDLGIAELPSQLDPEVPVLPIDISELLPEEQKELKIRRYNAIKRKNELQSERPTFKLKLKVAQEFENAHNMYFPHNIDFRGRAYPIPPHLNHISDDICRGLLMFAEQRPLGKDGLSWLKISLANLLGKDKLPFQERIDFIDDNRDSIVQAAREPLSEAGIKLWANADDGPWQALARCMELADVWSSGDEEGFLSSLPIHLDGSCNGLQHYAALGRDEMGAKAVNLTPSERPQDVYMIVLELVVKKVHKDAEKTDNIDRQEHARRLIEFGLLKRKVVKQTIMTICYGVTSVGAKLQVQGQLEDLVGERLEPQEIKLMAGYLSQLVLKSIDEVFERAMLIKRWFDKVSSIMNKHEVPVMWISPVGLACHQPYRRQASVTVKTKRQTVMLRTKESPAIDKARQRMGFPPNYVHSLDSAHMMMVAEGCQEHGIYFAGVHDSFWTHPGDAPTLNRIIREKFVELHSRPLLQELYEDFRVQLGSSAHLLPDLPEPSTLNLELVKDSPYMFD